MTISDASGGVGEPGFVDRLAALAAREAPQALRDPDRAAAAIEALANALGMMAAAGARGDVEAMNTMLEGASQYAFTRAVISRR